MRTGERTWTFAPVAASRAKSEASAFVFFESVRGPRPGNPRRWSCATSSSVSKQKNSVNKKSESKQKRIEVACSYLRNEFGGEAATQFELAAHDELDETGLRAEAKQVEVQHRELVTLPLRVHRETYCAEVDEYLVRAAVPV